MSAEDDQEQDVPPTPSLDDDGDLSSDDPLNEDGGGLSAKKIILFFVLPLFILVGVGGGLYFTGTLDKMLGGGGTDTHAEEDSHGKQKKSDGHGGDDGHGGYDAGVYFLQIPNMVVNLSGENGQPRYLKLSVQLELDSVSDQQAVEAVMPRVIDQFQTYLRELRVRDLRGSQGIYRLQMELLSRVNAAAYPVEVKDVLFQEILIQ